MIPTISWTKQNFSKLNKMYFNNELPEPTFRLKKARTFFGQFSWYREIRGIADGEVLMTAKEVSKQYGFPNGILSMSTRYDRPEKDCLGTLLHEMIHLYQFVNETVDHGHGSVFKTLATKFNREGWGIQRVEGYPTESCYNKYCMNATPSEAPAPSETPAPSCKSKDAKYISSKIGALRRSIAILEGKMIQTPSVRLKLELRRAELEKFLSMK